MKNFKKYIIASLIVVLMLNILSCTDFDEMLNPNEMTVDTFWQNEGDAVKGVNATYSSLQLPGVYKKWMVFLTDASSDEGMSTSPWTDLANVSKFSFVDYNFVVLYEVFRDHYRGIFRANQVIASVPRIDMDEAMKNRLLGEAKFIRALLYYNLVNIWGNVPLATEAENENKLGGYPQLGIDAVYALIEDDLMFAKNNLPKMYGDDDLGRATKGAATALLGKAYMQQHKWAEAEKELAEVVNSGEYELVANYADNFTHYTENNKESIFEVQFSDMFLNSWDQDGAPNSSVGSFRSIFTSPAGWSDIEGTPGMLQHFKDYSDPRLKNTYVYDNPTETYYGLSYADLSLGARAGSQWFRKFIRHYYETEAGEKVWDSPINTRVIRFSDILLLYAEALEHNGNTGLAEQQITRVRNRVNAGPSPFIAAGQTLAKTIENERIMELCGESVRFFDLRRLGYFEDAAKLSELKARDPEFNSFNIDTKGYFPFPNIELNTNSNEIVQNPGW